MGEPPAEVRRAAADLGQLRRVEHLVTEGRYYWTVAGIGLVGVGALVVLGWLMELTPESWFRLVLGCFGLGVLVTVAWVVAERLRWARAVGPVDLYEYDGGYVRSSRLDTTVFPFADVAFVEHVYQEGAKGGTRRLYWLRRLDEAGRSTEPLALHRDAESIAARVTEAALPDALAAARSSTGVTFGPLTLGPDGVTHGGTTIPWARLDRVVREGDEIRAYRHGQPRPWVRAPIGAVPNAPVLLAVAERFLADFHPA